MKQFLLIIFLSTSSIFFAACTQLQDKEVQQSPTSTLTIQDHQLIDIQAGDAHLTVEAVTSPASITLGLGQRDEIGSDGMLFFLPEKRVANFWMHGMRFPIDIVWIDDTTIVGIEQNLPAPADPNSTALPSYSSDVPVTHVLELPAGKAEELDLNIGTSVRYNY